jgi:hypothetical protein
MGSAQAMRLTAIIAPAIRVGCYFLAELLGPVAALRAGMNKEGNAEEHESGVVRTVASSKDPTVETLDRLCHRIIDAASALTVDVEFIAGATPGEERQACLDSARCSIGHIVTWVQSIRGRNAQGSATGDRNRSDDREQWVA